MTLRTRVPLAMALASALAFVLGARGFDEFAGVRSKVVTGIVPAPGGALHLTVDGRGTVARLKPPFALIAHLRNGSAEPAPFRVAVDGQTVCEPRLAGQATAPSRVDCVVTSDWPPRPSHTIDLTSPAPTWSLEGLELASHHGASTGPIQLVAVPRGATSYVRPSLVEVVVFWLACLGLFLLPPAARLPRFVRWGYRLAVGLTAALLLATVVVPWVSRFALIVSWATLARAAVVLAIPALWHLGGQIAARLSDRRVAWAALARPALVGLLALLPFVLVMRGRLEHTYLGNYSGFIQIGRSYVDNSPYIAHDPDVRRTLVVVEGGYDGQFMYYAAWDPLLRAYRADPSRFDGLIDTPPYRFGRIGYVWLTWLASLGDWHRFPKTMVWLELAAIFTCAFAMAVFARDVSASVAWGLVALCIPAFWQSMETTLPEPVAAAFLLLAYLAWRRGWWIRTGLLLSASLLVRETGLAFLAVLVGAMWRRGERREAIQMALLAAGPFVLWHVYVGWVLYAGWGFQGFFFKPELLTVPFAGFVELWSHLRAGQYEGDLALAAVWLPMLLTAGWLVALASAVTKPSALTVGAALYATMAISLNFTMVWVHTRNGERVTYETFVLLALVSAELAARSRRWKAALLAFWAVAGIYVFWVGFDGQFYRETLVPPFWRTPSAITQVR